MTTPPTATTTTRRMTTFIGHVTHEHLAALAQPTPDDLSGRSPALKAIAAAAGKGYDAVCMPLTTDRWRARWRAMCLLSGEEAQDDADKDTDTDADTDKEREEDKALREQQAEQWRAHPVFLKDEVTITRLGAQVLLFVRCVSVTDVFDLVM